MADDTRKLQKDPPEGSRKVVEHEIARQDGRNRKKQESFGDAPRGKKQGEQDSRR
jgi:hypothetical protein